VNKLKNRGERLLRLVAQDAPSILIRSEALLILAAALELDGGRDAQRQFAQWLTVNTRFAPDGGTLADLRNDTIDECIEATTIAMSDLEDSALNVRIDHVTMILADLRIEAPPIAPPGSPLERALASFAESPPGGAGNSPPGQFHELHMTGAPFTPDEQGNFVFKECALGAPFSYETPKCLPGCRIGAPHIGACEVLP